MRIVHWDEMFHPSFGYQINVLTKFQAKQGHEIIIVTSDKIEKHPVFSGFADHTDIVTADNKFQNETGIKIIRLPIVGVYSGRVIYKPGYINILNKLKPDVLMCHTHDTLSGIRITQYAPRADYPVVFDSHMLEMASRNPFNRIFRLYYRKFIAPIYRRHGYVVVRTQDDPYVEQCLGIPLSQAPFISFGTDTELFEPNESVRNKFRESHSISKDDFVVVYTGKISETKGGRLLAKAFGRRFPTNRNVILIAVGNTAGSYGEEVEQSFSRARNRIIRFPTQKYQDLPRFYQASDLCVFPKQVSLSFFDAQACGLPVVSEDNNINIDRLKHNNGLTFRTDDVDDFREKILRCVDMPKEKYQQMKRFAIQFIEENYDYREIAKQYTDILIQEYQRFHGIHGQTKAFD